MRIAITQWPADTDYENSFALATDGVFSILGAHFGKALKQFFAVYELYFLRQNFFEIITAANVMLSRQNRLINRLNCSFEIIEIALRC